MNSIYTSLLVLLMFSVSAQERVEFDINIMHTLEDFELTGNVKEMTTIPTGFDYEDGTEIKLWTFVRTKYFFNRMGKVDSVFYFDGDSSLRKIVTISYDKQGDIKTAVEAESFYHDLRDPAAISKEVSFEYVISSDLKAPKKVLSIAVNRGYEKHKLLYRYDKNGKLTSVKNLLTEEDSKKIEKSTVIKAFKKKYTYNKDGSVKKIKSTYTRKVTLSLDNTEYFEYDSKGDLTDSYQKQRKKDEWSPPQRRTYSDKGQVVHYYEGDSTVNEEVYTHTINYFNEDQMLTGYYYHAMGDGEFEQMNRFEYSWDESGNWIEVKTYLKETAHHYKKEGEKIPFRLDRRDKRVILYYE